ncbi:MAG: branched-chain amino acid ABC transporter permease [Actinomycetota bacterium]
MLLVILLAVAPGFFSAQTKITLIGIFTYLALAQMWNLLAGYAGLVSIGQQAFVGVAAYAVFVLAERNGVPLLIAVLGAGLVAAVLAVPSGAVALRLHGGYFAVGSWVLAEVFRLATLRIDALGAGDIQSFSAASAFSGLSIDQRQNLLYWSALALGAGGTLLVVAILRSRVGLALKAVADDEGAAQALGVDVWRVKLAVWIVAAFWCGLAGAVIHLSASTVTNDNAFSVADWTATVIFIVVVGGVSSVSGPVLGVGVYWIVTEVFEDATTWRLIVLGVLAVIVAVAQPRGIFGLVERRRRLPLFPVRRRLVAPGRE